MLLPRLGALLLATSAVYASNEPSPFFLVSSDPLSSNATLHSTQLAKSRDVEDRLIESLSDCSARRYTIFSQRGVSAQDFQSKNGFSRTRKRLAEAKDGALVEIPNVGVLWDMDGERVRERLLEACLHRGKVVVEDGAAHGGDEVAITHSTLQELPLDEKTRSRVIAQADKDLDKEVENVITAKTSEKAVFIYITTSSSPSESHSHIYEMDEPYSSTAMHTDLKRDVRPRQDDIPSDAQAGLPLFETYQFLTPGIFMGLFVSLLLFVILYVGISAISGLEVSYAAFRKEMGPQAQKSKQQ